jgi:hypothetical protein
MTRNKLTGDIMHDEQTPRGNDVQLSIEAERVRLAAIIGRLLARYWLRTRAAEKSETRRSLEQDLQMVGIPPIC